MDFFFLVTKWGKNVEDRSHQTKQFRLTLLFTDFKTLITAEKSIRSTFLALVIRNGKKKCYNYLKIKNKCYHGAGRAGGSLDEGPGLSEQPGQGRAGGGADGAAPALDTRNLCGNEDRLMLG